MLAWGSWRLPLSFCGWGGVVCTVIFVFNQTTMQCWGCVVLDLGLGLWQKLANTHLHGILKWFWLCSNTGYLQQNYNLALWGIHFSSEFLCILKGPFRFCHFQEKKSLTLHSWLVLFRGGGGKNTLCSTFSSNLTKFNKRLKQKKMKFFWGTPILAPWKNFKTLKE